MNFLTYFSGDPCPFEIECLFPESSSFSSTSLDLAFSFYSDLEKNFDSRSFIWSHSKSKSESQLLFYSCVLQKDPQVWKRMLASSSDSFFVDALFYWFCPGLTKYLPPSYLDDLFSFFISSESDSIMPSLSNSYVSMINLSVYLLDSGFSVFDYYPTLLVILKEYLQMDNAKELKRFLASKPHLVSFNA